MIKHIVMWNILGATPDEKAGNLQRLKAAFEGMRTHIPGLLRLEIGVDESRVDYACDVVLYSEFESRQALNDYAEHPEHLRVRRELEGVRIARHQVDFEAP
ncbi:MAG: Dabb family protein [Hydrogenophaga sp.]|jgi:heme-degrading monooxygenase HmoA|uniref:Dabb family protein n=1 Tax=Hydrogenophaga sp. TaxID=1904254 RepID=UPI001DC1EC93|nr:Dabb family protein [Hydrogenophaga sp.]MBW0168782.1 Dabb family protein [Hydrogenophaga sp.]MBW0185302.1 Dabb family protein [Hydrogenophaga sp.]